MPRAPDDPPSPPPGSLAPSPAGREALRRRDDSASLRRTFFGAFAGSTRTTSVGWALLATNVAVFAAMVATGTNAWTPDVDDLVRWGALQGIRTRDEEPLRLLTACFLHVGALHLAVNMWSLWALRIVETWFGHLGFAVLYLVSGLAGSLASTAFGDPFTVGAGASGALFGVVGGVLGAAVRWRRLGVDARVTTPLVRSVTSMLLLNGLIALTVRNLDHAAHVGGLAGGAVLGFALAHEPSSRGVATRARRGWTVGLASLLVVAAAVALLRAPGLTEAGERVETERADEDLVERWARADVLPARERALAEADWLPSLVARAALLDDVASRFPSTRNALDPTRRRVADTIAGLRRLVAERAPTRVRPP